jgi:Uroporphyrinogen decarboxylase (URO-D)
MYMSEMTSRERVRAVLAREIPDRVPYVENGIDFPFICRLLDLDLPAGKFFESGEYESPPIEIQLAGNRVLHRDNVVYNILPPIPAIKHPGRDGILFFADGRIKSANDLESFQLPNPASEEFLGPARRFLAQAGDYATICTCRVGISATYLAMGMEHFYYCLYDNPNLVQELLQRYTDFAAGVVEQAAQLGFDIFWTSDDIAFRSGPLISPGMFRELIVPHVRKVADRVRDMGIPWIYHSDGDLTPLIEDFLELGISVLNPIEPLCMDIREMKKQFGSRVILCGNLDVNLLAGGTPDQVRTTTLELLRDVAPGGGYLLASGNSVSSFCKVECVKAMCDTLFEYGRYPIQV